ncbi:metal binding domain of Ada-domain-containing protein, partial [Massariosphaeria phaeospora]
MSFTTDNARWRALTHRDPAANGKFVYSVKSTNIYCRPICAARLARRANCGFYKTPAEAEAAGFRACKRCKPEIENVENPQELAVGKACTLIERAMKEDDPKSIKLRDLAKSVGLTPRYFHKIFKDKTGLTPKEY